MTVLEYFVNKLIEENVTDVFGIPGLEILKLIYAIDTSEGIQPHLTYNEQGAGYMACGYAHATGRLGVAYATKGPGVLNLITPMANAYCSSLPTLFVTAHTEKYQYQGMRVDKMKEMDLLGCVSEVTKYSGAIDDIGMAKEIIDEAFLEAKFERKGPVFLDFYTKILDDEIPDCICSSIKKSNKIINNSNWKESLQNSLAASKRPVILIGDAMRFAKAKRLLEDISNKYKIPILSSRISQDIFKNSKYYFGYIGSRGNRYSNFILEKADVLISIGNRMAFPVDSKTFRPIFTNKKVFRFEIDEIEFKRQIPNCENIMYDIDNLEGEFGEVSFSYRECDAWIDVCNQLKVGLINYDTEDPIPQYISLLNTIPDDYTIISDVGTNEMWLAKAYSVSKCKASLLSAKYLEDLGSSIGKAIGAYYSTRKPVICFCGDEGFQFNIQELSLIGREQLPISIVVANNNSCGTINYLESKSGYSYSLHSTKESGFYLPDLRKICDSYGINYKGIDYLQMETLSLGGLKNNGPIIIDCCLPDNMVATPILPKGDNCSDLYPRIDRELYEEYKRL